MRQPIKRTGKNMKVPRREETTKSVPERRLARILAVALLPFALLSLGNASAEWQFDPVLRVAWDSDNNATLSPVTVDEIDLSGFIAEASLDAIYTSQRSYLSMRPIIRSRNYGDDEDVDPWNADDQFFELLGLFEGDKNSFRIFGDFSREAVRTAETADADLDTEIDPDDIADDQSGFIDTSQRRNRYRIAPRWSHYFSDVSSITTNLSYQTTSYDEPDEPGVLQNLFDFTDVSMRVEYRRNMSERNSAVFGIRARDYNTDRFGGDRQTYEISGGFIRRLSETTQFRAKVGLESVDHEDIGVATASIDPQPTGELTLSRNLKTIRLFAQYRKRVSASGRGVLTARDELNLRFTRALNDRVTVGLGARAYINKTIRGFDNRQDYVQFRGQVAWNLSRSFLMQADYRHTVIDRGGPEGAADSNRVTIWLSYRPNAVGRDDRLRVSF